MNSIPVFLQKFCLPFALLAAVAAHAGTEKYFTIEVVDEETGRGVPLVELVSVNNIRHVTDSAGRVAFHEPGLMDREVFFAIESHGYEYPADPFGYRCIRPMTTPGESVRVPIRRTMPAERLYRLSGGGIYRDTVLLGLEPPIREPVLNATVVGQDSVLGIVYNDRIHWFWGDTLRPAYPFGNFHASGAVSPLPGPDGTDAERGIEYTYFIDEETGFAKEVAPMPGDGPTWLEGLTVVPDRDGRNRMVAGYAKIRDQLHAYARGIIVWDDERDIFEQVTEFSPDEPLYPTGHSLTLEEGGTEYVYYTRSLPIIRVPAVFEKVTNIEMFEAFTPLRAGSSWEDRDVERDADGNVVYGWKTGTPEVNPGRQIELINDGLLSEEEALFAPRDFVTGASVRLHTGGAEWNPYRERWVLIVSEIFGTSSLGEVWFMEADSPLGPWIYARKIITHDNYSFYNPKHHRFLDREDGRIIYIDGTYTEMFSGATRVTPRYDYNQILYRLDLGDPRLRLPAAMYRETGHEGRCHLSARQGANGGTRPAFWAFESPAEDTLPVRCAPAGDDCRFLVGEAAVRAGEPHFHALRPDIDEPPPGTIPLEGENGETVAMVWEHPTPKGPILPIQRGR